MLWRGLNRRPNRLSHRVTPRWKGHPWSPSPDDFSPETVAPDRAKFWRTDVYAIPGIKKLLRELGSADSGAGTTKIGVPNFAVRFCSISLHSIHYWSPVLSTWVGGPRKMNVRYDPRDLSRIYLLAPDGQYYDLSYRDVCRPPISLWEHHLALKRLREEGRTRVDEAAIFSAVEQMRAIADEAIRASKVTRRQRERRLRLIQGGKVDPSQVDSPAEQVNPIEEEAKR
jgi:hypothetical protein